MPKRNETDYRGVGIGFDLSVADKLNMMPLSIMPKPSEMDRITAALERGMEEAVEDIRRERAGWHSLAVERELLAELETFMSDQSAPDQTRGATVERRNHYDRVSCNLQWLLAGIFGVMVLIILYFLFR
jgi:hypothetical protein